MKFSVVLYLLPTALASQFVCPTTKSLNTMDSWPVNEASCCGNFKATCGVPTSGATAPFACTDASKMYRDTSSQSSPPSVDSCCFDLTCNEANVNKEKHVCPTGFGYNDDNEQMAPSNANCCKALPAFEPLCYMYTKYADTFPYDIFPCSAGTTLITVNGAHAAKNPSQAQCCGAFSPTCKFNSGSIFDQVKFDCAAVGKGYQHNDQADVGDKASTVANCCVDFVPLCSYPVNNVMQPFQCPAGKVFNRVKADATAPSEAVCCTAPTCQYFSDATCADKTYCSDDSKEINSAAAALITQGWALSEDYVCCKPKAVTFSAALFSAAPRVGACVFALLAGVGALFV